MTTRLKRRQARRDSIHSKPLTAKITVSHHHMNLIRQKTRLKLRHSAMFLKFSSLASPRQNEPCSRYFYSHFSFTASLDGSQSSRSDHVHSLPILWTLDWTIRLYVGGNVPRQLDKNRRKSIGWRSADARYRRRRLSPVLGVDACENRQVLGVYWVGWLLYLGVIADLILMPGDCS